MYRSLFRFIRVYLSESNLDIHRNCLTKNITSSSCCIQQSHSPIIDDCREIPQYFETRYQRLSKLRFTNFLTTKLFCPPQRASEICSNYPKFSERTLQEVSRNVNFLTLKGVTESLILDNPWMLTLNHAQLSLNIHILQAMQPKNINDFAPLAIIPSDRLKRIQEIAKEETNIIPGNHRIYYLSELLHVSPASISKYVSSYLFILELPFSELDSRLQALLKFISPEDIVNHLKSLRLHASTIESKKAQAKESRASNSTKRSNAERAILGENSLAQYYSNRLNLDVDTIESMLQHYPELKKFSITLISEKLDYLLNEAGVTASEIVQSPYMLTKSLKTTKKRIEELKSHGCAKHFILGIVFQNSKRYEKFLARLEKSTEKYRR